MSGISGSIPNRAGGLTTFDAAPELALGGHNEVLVERVGRGGDLDPFAAAGDDGQDR